MSDLGEFPTQSEFWDEIEPAFRRIMKRHGISQKMIDWVCSDLSERSEDPELCEEISSQVPERCEPDLPQVLDCFAHLDLALQILRVNMKSLEIEMYRTKERSARKRA